MATYRKLPSGNWRVEIAKHGKRKSATFNLKGEAVAWANQIEHELNAGAGKAAHIKTLAQAMDRYQQEITPAKKGARWESIRIDKLRRELPFVGKLIGDVDVTDISSWRDLSLSKLEASTVN